MGNFELRKLLSSFLIREQKPNRRMFESKPVWLMMLFSLPLGIFLGILLLQYSL